MKELEELTFCIFQHIIHQSTIKELLLMKKGIDISHVNGVIDWEKVKPQIEFAMIRAGYGNNNIDEAFEVNASACEALGIPIGLYWFSYAYTPEMAKKEAIDCINQAKKYNIEYPIAFDFEYDSVRYAQEYGVAITKELAVELMKAFCNEIKRVGYRVAVYTNRDFLENYYTLEEIGKQDYEIWYAHYSEEMERKQVSLWQYSSGGHIEGINGRVDLDYSLEDIVPPTYGWQKQDGKWWYKRPDGSYPASAWEKIDNIWYHFDEDGYMQTGWIQYKEKWYYLKSSGAMASNELLTVESPVHGTELYAFSTEGHMMCTNERGALI